MEYIICTKCILNKYYFTLFFAFLRSGDSDGMGERKGRAERGIIRDRQRKD